MATTGAKYPGTGSELTISGGSSWSNEANITNSSTSEASSIVGFNTGNYSNYLYPNSYPFNIPDSAEINGIIVRMSARAQTANQRRVRDVWLYVNGGRRQAKMAVNDVLSTTAATFTYGSSTDTWGLSSTYLTGAAWNAASSGVNAVFENYRGNEYVTVYVRWITIELYYTVNTPPTVGTPTISYGSYTRLGPSNTPVTLSFTATDPEDTGTNALSYTIRTASNGGGTLVGSGTATSGTQKNHSISNSASGLVDGNNTLYVRAYDGKDYSTDRSIILLRDTGAPSVGAITYSPDPVTESGE